MLSQLQFGKKNIQGAELTELIDSRPGSVRPTKEGRESECLSAPGATRRKKDPGSWWKGKNEGIVKKGTGAALHQKPNQPGSTAAARGV